MQEYTNMQLSINKIDNFLFKCLSICFTDLFDKSRAFIIYQQINGKSRLENNGMLEVLCNKTRNAPSMIRFTQLLRIYVNNSCLENSLTRLSRKILRAPQKVWCVEHFVIILFPPFK